MDTTAPQDALKPRYREVRKVTLIGSLVDLLLGIAKILFGWLAHSQALVADGIHSLSDLATDVIVLYAAKHSHREADEDHRQGEDRLHGSSFFSHHPILTGPRVGPGPCSRGSGAAVGLGVIASHHRIVETGSLGGRSRTNRGRWPMRRSGTPGCPS